MQSRRERPPVAAVTMLLLVSGAIAACMVAARGAPSVSILVHPTEVQPDVPSGRVSLSVASRRCVPRKLVGLPLTDSQPTSIQQPFVVTVKDDAGDPVENAEVGLMQGPWRAHARGRTDEKGQTSIRRLLPVNAVRVTFDDDTFNERVLDFAVAVGATCADVEVPRTIAVRGTLTLEGDESISLGTICVERDGVVVDDLMIPIFGLTKAFTIHMGLDDVVDLYFIADPRGREHRWGHVASYVGCVRGVSSSTRNLELTAVCPIENKTLEVRVFDPKGNPVKGLNVQLDTDLPDTYTHGRIRRRGGETTDRDGLVSFNKLLDAPTRVDVELVASPSRLWRMPTIERVSPRGQIVSIRLEEGTPISGRAIDHKGEALVGATVTAEDMGVVLAKGRVERDGRFALALDAQRVEPVTLRCVTETQLLLLHRVVPGTVDLLIQRRE